MSDTKNSSKQITRASSAKRAATFSRGSSPLQLLQFIMDPLHETVKVDPHLAFEGQRLIEGIHEIGLATADASQK